MKKWIYLAVVMIALLLSACGPSYPGEISEIKANSSADDVDSYLAKLSLYSDKELESLFEGLSAKLEKADDGLFDGQNAELYATVLELNHRGLSPKTGNFTEILDIFYLYACNPWRPAIYTASPLRTFGSLQSDAANDVYIDRQDHIYIVGMTEGNMISRTFGGRDAFICTFDARGKALWAKQFGTADADEANGVTVADNGTIYVVGRMGQKAEPQPEPDPDPDPVPLATQASSTSNAFIRAYSASGRELWTDQFGNQPGSWGIDVATNSNVVFMVGRRSSQNFVRSYSPGGWLNGEDLFAGIGVEDVAVTSENYAYVVGWNQKRNSPQGFVETRSYIRTYKSNAGLLKDFDFGLANPKTGEAVKATGVALDSADRPYVVGYTNGTFGARLFGRTDAFVLRYSDSAGIVWKQQFGSTEDDQAVAVDLSPNNKIYVAGRTTGNLAGQNLAYFDVFLHSFSTSGSTLSATQIGTVGYDYTQSVAVNSANESVVVGSLLNNGSNAFAGRLP
ncbi:MAG: hypothetical protein KC422_22970 [Trueperaceae bacterium]|nr:hypothetical protein [Trueperaceae bacterium]